ncbi:MAG TPA: thioredoxin domain-containing protein, partial [Chromatiaceae bacterium]|nr:thioredoxin domain-containing protein [Chromatiaceae bacterium]
MLYDNGQLVSLYAKAYQLTKNPLYKNVVTETLEYIQREMTNKEGGFYSSLDADSEGEEGKFYVWKRDELRSLLSDEEYGVFASLFGLDRNPNFEGQWHLHRFESMEKIAAKRNLAVGRVQELVDSARDKLFTAREQRARPGRDDKILTSWNALMIRGMARAGRLLGRPEWVDSAEQALDFIHRELWRDGRLLAVHKDGVSHLAAYLDDYAWLIQALLEILQCRWDSARLLWALELAEVMLAHYQDREEGGFYFTADDHEQLIQRPRSFTDDATPSGNGIAAQVLLELAHLSGEMRYLEAAERTLKAAWGSICQAPHAHASLVLAL